MNRKTIEQDEEDINMEVDNTEGQVVTGQTRRVTNTTSPENRVTWADVVSRPATRSTTRASEMARALVPVQRPRNAALIRQMASLSGPGIYRNPVAETVLNEARQQEQALKNQLPPVEDEHNQDNENEDNNEVNNAQSGRDMASFGLDGTIDQLFGDFALFVRENLMDQENHSNVEVETVPEVDDNETKLLLEVNTSKQHIIDLLDETIRNDRKMKESDRLIKLKHIV